MKTCHSKRILLFLSFLLISLVVPSCTKDMMYKNISTEYRAFCVLDVACSTILNNVVYSLNQFCTIRQKGNAICITLAGNSQTENYPQVKDVLHDFRGGLGGGFIFGRNYSGEFRAYDIACPICHRQDFKLDVSDDGFASCKNCKSKFELNDNGWCVSNTSEVADKVRPLFQYRAIVELNYVNSMIVRIFN